MGVTTTKSRMLWFFIASFSIHSDFSLSLLLFFFSEVHLHPKIDKQYKPSFIKLTFGKFLYKPPNFQVYHPRFTNFHPEENKSQHSQSED